MESMVKLTLRIPKWLHEQLKQRAQSSKRSLNTEIVDTLQGSLEQVPSENLTEAQRVQQLLHKSGLWEPPGPHWKKYSQNAPQITHAELRERLKGVPPLSEAILEEREPR